MPKHKALDDPKQAAAFRKAARDLGADSDETRFQDALRKVAKHKPAGRLETGKPNSKEG
jgi:hypothetical protein